MLQLRAALRGIEEKLERAGVKMSREELLESDDGPPDVRRAKALFRGFYEALSDEIEQIRALGGEVKDIEQGLVDFPGAPPRRGDPALLAARREDDRLLARGRVRLRGPPSDRRRRRARAAAAGLGTGGRDVARARARSASAPSRRC